MPGAFGSRIGHKDFHKKSNSEIHPYEDRQHVSVVLPSEDGGHGESHDDRHNKTHMGISFASSDHDYCGMDSLAPQYDSGLGIETHEGYSRVEVMSEGFQTDLSKPGASNSGLVCIQDFPSAERLFQLEGRSRLLGSGCIQSELETVPSLCFSSVLSDLKSSEAGNKTTSGEIDFNLSSVAIPTMVPTVVGNGYLPSHSSSQLSQSINKPFRRDSPSITKFISETSGLVSVRDRLIQSGVPQNACELILNARRKGTTKNYDSTWKKWFLWCDRRGVDAFTCPLNEILGYLATLFDNKYQYRSIGVHRSAISAYHIPIDGVPIGKHPEVSRLMAGVHNLRPPQPRYGFTWDVELVLSMFRSWPYILSPKQLSLKTATLMGLIAIPRGAELHQMDLNYLIAHQDKYRFDLAGLVKNVKQGKKPAPIEFYRHEDPNLCPLRCIDSYITMTNAWRDKGRPTALFLSYVSPHKPISKSRLAGWIKDSIKLAGIDSNIFTAHSVRGASSSKVFLQGLSAREVINHGSWSCESTWQKFYHKQVDSATKKFQEKVLGL